MSTGPRPDGPPRHYGVYPALVTDIVDPDNIGRIQVKLPWLGEAGKEVRAWATLITPYADDDQGFEFIPGKDSQVVVAFEAGHLRRPYVVGACWNGRAAPIWWAPPGTGARRCPRSPPHRTTNG